MDGGALTLSQRRPPSPEHPSRQQLRGFSLAPNSPQTAVADAPEASEHQRISCVAFPVLVERLGNQMSNESVLECVQRMKDEAIRKES